MGLFDKKFCDICGEKIGLLGNRKLEDGNLCKDCAKKLSPFFSDRRRSTVEDIRKQLELREENRKLLAAFHPTQILGGRTKVYIDPAMGKFAVSHRSDLQEENADLIDLSAVVNATYDVEEDREELYTEDEEGKSVPFNPPQFEYSYEITLHIEVNHPYINDISFEVTDSRPDSRDGEAFRQYEQTANEIVCALTGREAPPAEEPPAEEPPAPVPQGTVFPMGFGVDDPEQPAPPAEWFCPYCGTKNGGNFCMNCGAKKPF